MARRYEFLVVMEVHDEDQTDPDEMVAVLSDVLNARDARCLDWHEAQDEALPEWRARFTVHGPSVYRDEGEGSI
jgi:hypothetical protein